MGSIAQEISRADHRQRRIRERMQRLLGQRQDSFLSSLRFNCTFLKKILGGEGEGGRSMAKKEDNPLNKKISSTFIAALVEQNLERQQVSSVVRKLFKLQVRNRQ